MIHLKSLEIQKYPQEFFTNDVVSFLYWEIKFKKLHKNISHSLESVDSNYHWDSKVESIFNLFTQIAKAFGHQFKIL